MKNEAVVDTTPQVVAVCATCGQPLDVQLVSNENETYYVNKGPWPACCKGGIVIL